MATPYEILDRKRAGMRWTVDQIRSAVAGSLNGSWSEAQLGAFLMAAAVRGLDSEETDALTRAMLESGDQWALSDAVPGLADKHSTGGVGDKTSLVIGPLLAACGQPIVMLTGRGLGHTAGTADKLESIPGLDLELNRIRSLRLLEETGLAIGVATEGIAPADRKLYGLRDTTGTVVCPALIVASILSKKLASGAQYLAFDVKTGNGAFLPGFEDSVALGQALVDTCADFNRRAVALVTDMSQPLGRWSGHTAEVGEAIECLSGGGPADLRELVLALCSALCDAADNRVTRQDLEAALDGGAARQRFASWAEAQGAEAGWIDDWTTRLAPHEVTLEASRSGVVTTIETRQIGLLLVEAGAGRRKAGDTIDLEVALETHVRVGDAVDRGAPLCTLYLRQTDDDLVQRARSCFQIGETGTAPRLIHRTLLPRGG